MNGILLHLVHLVFLSIRSMQIPNENFQSMRPQIWLGLLSFESVLDMFGQQRLIAMKFNTQCCIAEVEEILIIKALIIIISQSVKAPHS